jgi:hypothetical protein
MEQTAERRYVLHLMYAAPTLRGGAGVPGGHGIEILEELVPLHDVACAIRPPKRVREIRLVPSGEPLAFLREGDAVSFVLPRLEGHQMLELSW